LCNGPAIDLDDFNGGFQVQTAAGGHRVAGVEREVDDRVLDLVRVDLDVVELLGQVRGDLDVLTDDALQHPGAVADHIIEIDDLWRQDGFAAERQQLAG